MLRYALERSLRDHVQAAGFHDARHHLPCKQEISGSESRKGYTFFSLLTFGKNVGLLHHCLEQSMMLAVCLYAALALESLHSNYHFARGVWF